MPSPLTYQLSVAVRRIPPGLFDSLWCGLSKAVGRGDQTTRRVRVRVFAVLENPRRVRVLVSALLENPRRDRVLDRWIEAPATRQWTSSS